MEHAASELVRCKSQMQLKFLTPGKKGQADANTVAVATVITIRQTLSKLQLIKTGRTGPATTNSYKKRPYFNTEAKLRFVKFATQ